MTLCAHLYFIFNTQSILIIVKLTMIRAVLISLLVILLSPSAWGYSVNFRSSLHRLNLNVQKMNSPTLLLCKKGIDIYENEEILVDLDDTANDLALETFKELSLQSDSVSVQAFIEWEDIQEVMARGFIDKETLGIILKELGIKSGFMDFAQFKEAVDMVNHVNAALEQNAEMGEDDADLEDDESFFPPGEEDDEDDETMKWLEKQLKS